MESYSILKQGWTIIFCGQELYFYVLNNRLLVKVLLW